MSPVTLQIAVPGPFRTPLDYLAQDASGRDLSSLPVGCRVEVPLGRRQVTGVVLGSTHGSELSAQQLRAVSRVIDTEPALDSDVLGLVRWAADYYHHPLGDALQQALPVRLRRGEAAREQQRYWRLTRLGLGLGESALGRAPRQAEAVAALRGGPRSETGLLSSGITRDALRALARRDFAEAFEQAGRATAPAAGSDASSPGPALHPEQAVAVAAVEADAGRFGCSLLEGVTGSGKTEVYLRLIESSLARGQQALVLVPEIGLTPQTLERFRRRLPVEIALLHSGLTDLERLQAWRAARDGQARVVIGTRSAVFTPMPELGLIVIDEEHDASYKQQDGFRYHARDVAIKRAADRGIPILLGSATPSLETLRHAGSGQYRHLCLRERAAGALAPEVRLVDTRLDRSDDGLSTVALTAIADTLARGEQALVFINRRGFAPTLMCPDCGWIGECNHCDARLTVHAARRRLICHHCGYQQPLPPQCPGCHGTRLDFLGPGTERCEQALHQHFPGTPVLRVDRDTTSGKRALHDLLQQVASGAPCILVGTQMLAKGHHFPDVTLVVVVDLDGGLFSADFRGAERTGQLLVQVAGRAGRGQRPGQVLIQTGHPEHPWLATLVDKGYATFARTLLAEREASGLPPCGHMALLRADARQLQAAERFLGDLRNTLPTVPGASLLGPLPAPMTRRAGRYRAQLILHARERRPLHQALALLRAAAEQHPAVRQLHWSVDVDPQDTQ